MEGGGTRGGCHRGTGDVSLGDLEVVVLGDGLKFARSVRPGAGDHRAVFHAVEGVGLDEPPPDAGTEDSLRHTGPLGDGA